MLFAKDPNLFVNHLNRFTVLQVFIRIVELIDHYSFDIVCFRVEWKLGEIQSTCDLYLRVFCKSWQI